MLIRLLVALVLALAVALGWALAISAGAAPESSPAPAKGASRPLSTSRLYMLMPDGRVEINDGWTRRVFRWDGRRWLELSGTALPAPAR